MKVASKLIPYYSESGFDTLIADEKKQLFAVFDGMGTSSDSLSSAAFLQNNFNRARFALKNYQELANRIGGCQDKINILYPSGGATATIVIINGRGDLHYAHVGDSRLYVLKGTRVKQITADEAVENVLYNYVGKYGRGVNQLGFIENTEWDAFLLCSDGITGDRTPDLVTDQQIEEALIFGATAQDALERILKLSTKKDDKSIIVAAK